MVWAWLVDARPMKMSVNAREREASNRVRRILNTRPQYWFFTVTLKFVLSVLPCVSVTVSVIV